MEDNPLETIEDYQRSMDANSMRWFPNAYSSTHDAILMNVLGICGEAGEIADEFKKYKRGSIDAVELVKSLNEESIDMWHYLAQLWLILGTDVRSEYIKKTEFNEARFGPENKT